MLRNIVWIKRTYTQNRSSFFNLNITFPHSVYIFMISIHFCLLLFYITLPVDVIECSYYTSFFLTVFDTNQLSANNFTMLSYHFISQCPLIHCLRTFGHLSWKDLQIAFENTFQFVCLRWYGTPPSCDGLEHN